MNAPLHHPVDNGADQALADALLDKALVGERYIAAGKVPANVVATYRREVALLRPAAARLAARPTLTRGAIVERIACHFAQHALKAIRHRKLNVPARARHDVKPVLKAPNRHQVSLHAGGDRAMSGLPEHAHGILSRLFNRELFIAQKKNFGAVRIGLQLLHQGDVFRVDVNFVTAAGREFNEFGHLFLPCRAVLP